jgi:hypothetical protein
MGGLGSCFHTRQTLTMKRRFLFLYFGPGEREDRKIVAESKSQKKKVYKKIQRMALI